MPKPDFLTKENYSLPLDSIREIYHTEEPKVLREIEIILVLSGRGTQEKNFVDKTKQDKWGVELEDVDPEDDYLRMQRGIFLAKEVAAKRYNVPLTDLTNHMLTVKIVYNGVKEQNAILKKLIRQGKIDYPAHLFHLLDIPSPNTLGQVHSFNTFIEKQWHWLANNPTIAIVTSSFHIPRSARSFGNSSPQLLDDEALLLPKAQRTYHSWFSKKTFNLADCHLIFYGIDRQFQQKGTDKDILGIINNGVRMGGEINGMMAYGKGKKNTQPSISWQQPVNTYLSDIDLTFSKSFKNQKNTFFMGEPKTLSEACWNRGIKLLNIANTYFSEDNLTEFSLIQAVNSINKAIEEIKRYQDNADSLEEHQEAVYFLVELETTKTMIDEELSDHLENRLTEVISLSS